jgi:hypothetical protein
MSSRLSILFAWLVSSKRGRRLRRWSFVLTLPGAVAVALVAGVGSSLALVGVRVALGVIVLLAALRLGGERSEAVRDLLMHPRVRRYLRVELRVVAAPWLALAQLWRRDPAEFSYHRGDYQPAIALALVPALLAEAAVVHLLLPHGWLWAHLAVAAGHAYALLWLFAWAAGPRVRPHRVAGGWLIVRAGVLYEARVPLEAVEAVEVRRRRVGGDEAALVRDGEAVLLPARHRVDLWLELTQPVIVARPLGEPVVTRRLAIAADEPERLAAVLLGDAPIVAERRPNHVPGLVALPELVYGSH